MSDPSQLAPREKAEKDWLAKRHEGISTLIKGTGLIGASLFVGVALGIFSNTNDWIFIWLGLASWMACWGIILWSQGVNALVESRTSRRELGPHADDNPAQITQELAARERASLPQTKPGGPATTELAQQPSVTERTTELLNK